MLGTKSLIKKKFNKIFSFFYFLFESLTYPFRNRIINEILEPKKKKILDVCCGTGINSFILAKKGASVWGIDLSENQIKMAFKRRKKFLNLKLKFQIMDAEKLQFKDNFFDMVICSFGLHELGSLKVLENVIREVKRVLKPRGRLIIADYNNPKNKSIAYFLVKLIYLFEPKETLKIILNTTISEFSKKYQFKPVKEKFYYFNLLKLWILENK